MRQQTGDNSIEFQKRRIADIEYELGFGFITRDYLRSHQGRDAEAHRH